MRPFVPAVALSVVLAGAAHGGDITEREYLLPKCDKPVGTLTVGNIRCEASACKSPESGGRGSAMYGLMMMATAQGGMVPVSFDQIGQSLSPMLSTIVRETGCFDVQDRQSQEELRKELEAAGVKVAETKPSDYILTGSVTSISVTQHNKRVMWYRRNTQEANLSLDLKLIRVAEGARVLHGKTFDGRTERVSKSVTVHTPIGGFGGGSSPMKGTAMEDVARDVLARAAVYFTDKVAGPNITKRYDLQTGKDVVEAGAAAPALEPQGAARTASNP